MSKGRLPFSGSSSGRGLLRLSRCGAHEIFMTHKDGELRPSCVRFLGKQHIKLSMSVLLTDKSLHASPMWLFALYFSGMDTINRYWIPPQW